MPNDFSSEVNCQALWNLETGALGTDSKSTNILANTGVTADTTNFRQGVSGGRFTASENDRMTRADASLSAAYPHKSSDTTKKVSLCFWFYPLDTNIRVLYGKGGSGNWGTRIRKTSTRIQFYLATGSGLEFKSGPIGTISANQWYHVGITHDDSDKSFRIRVWDDNAGALLGADVTGTFTNNVALNSLEVELGSHDGGTSDDFNGTLDEFVVLNRILTADEIDEIRSGTFGPDIPINFIGSVTATSGASGAVLLTSGIASAITALSAAAGSLTVYETIELAETITGVSSASGSLQVSKSFVAAAAFVSATGGTINVSWGVSGITSATSGATSSLSATMSLQAFVTASSAVAGSLSGIIVPLAASITATSSATGALNVAQRTIGFYERTANQITTYFQGIADTNSFVVRFDNDPRPTPTDDVWYLASVDFGVANQHELGTTTSFRVVGNFSIRSQDAIGTGMGVLLENSDTITTAFRAKNVSRIIFGIPRINNTGRIGDNFQINITCPFMVDKQPAA